MRKTLAPLFAMMLIGSATASYGATIVGGHDCDEWTRRPSDGKSQWLLGYLSGLNVMHEFNEGNPKDPLAAVRSPNQLYQWMDSYCRKNPSSRLDAGASEMFIELMKQKQK